MTMDEKIKILSKPLAKEDIEVRVQSTNKGGVSIFLYKTSRIDIARLTEAFGSRYKIEFVEHSDKAVLCTISIFDNELGEWVSRSDIGYNDNSFDIGVQLKGKYSDALKRAGFRWGIGNELYTKGNFFIQCPTIYNNKKNKWEIDRSVIGYNNSLTIFDIAIENGKIIALKAGFDNAPYGLTWGKLNNTNIIDNIKDLRVKNELLKLPHEIMLRVFKKYNYDTAVITKVVKDRL